MSKFADTTIPQLINQANAGSVDAQIDLAIAYSNGENVDENKELAFFWAKKAADQNDAVGQYLLGRLYEFYSTSEADDIEAVSWYRLAAEQGNTSAKLFLSMFYILGRGVEEDKEKGLELLIASAEAGNCLAQMTMGFYYMKGLCFEKNDAEAEKWLRLSAEHERDEVAMARSLLNIMIEEGRIQA